jgi:hypothetical protein
VRLVAQAQACAYGESYEPIDVDLLFGEPTVALRGLWGGGDLVEIAPSARDLSPQRYEYHLDFPGNALDPGCDYERWARRLTKGSKPTVYAHVTTDARYPGKLALQYWLYYVFNDWNNTHEGDWEMIQLVFDAKARSRRFAVGRSPPATASTRAQSGRRGARTSSSWWAARIRSCTRPPARTQTSTRRPSTWAARARKASAATTREGPRSICARS